MITLGKMNLLVQARLNILDRSGEIAAAHAEFYGNVALPVFTVDHESAFVKRNVRDLSERHAAALWSRKQNIANRFRRAAEVRLITDHEIEAAIPLQNLCGRDA